jgi:hypothetical protein
MDPAVSLVDRLDFSHRLVCLGHGPALRAVEPWIVVKFEVF